MFRGALFVIVTVFFSVGAFAQSWQSVRAPAGAGTKYIATTKNSDGHTLSISRKIGRSGYEAFAVLKLGNGGKFGPEMPSFQIDNGKIEDARVITLAGENLGQTWGYLKDNEAGWRIWTSPVMELRRGDDLSPWRGGNDVIIRFVDDKGKSHKTTFSLSGSNTAITDAITGPFK